MIDKDLLVKKYVTEGRSAHDIALHLKCSDNKVNYWLKKYNIKKRTLSDAIYLKNNPHGDPFEFHPLSNNADWFLYGLGLGLFWGEGNKVDRHSVRLGNTDPMLINTFIEFLEKIYRVDRRLLKFGLQIFSDIDEVEAKKFWIQKLTVSNKQFQKVVITPTRGDGTYRKKSHYGVLTIYFSNVKLCANIMTAIRELQTTSYANVAQSVERTHGES